MVPAWIQTFTTLTRLIRDALAVCIAQYFNTCQFDGRTCSHAKDYFSVLD
jgi:hypothetical protein